jgi:predicted RNA binding protein YcfA (HicA-like mRNA interferase family)
MGKKDKLYRKAKESPENLSFTEICFLAEHVGFEFRNQSGSHKIYKHPKIKKMLNFQPDKRDKSKAKKYQAKQLVAIIENNNLMEG